MKTDVQLPEIKLPAKVKQFLNTMLSTVTLVLVIHVASLAVYSYIFKNDLSLVVSGFDTSEWGVWGRTFSLLPYLFMPLLLATLRVAGCSLTKLLDTIKRLTKSSGGATE